jgi:hypothetical protein
VRVLIGRVMRTPPGGPPPRVAAPLTCG